VSTNVFAWSLKLDQHYVISYRLAFVIACGLFMTSFLMAFKFPKRLNKPFIEQFQ